MSKLLYISRNYTEFGGFTIAEVLDFSQRGILRDEDHIRYHAQDDWLPVNEWLLLMAVTSEPGKSKSSSKGSKPAEIAPLADAAPPKATVAPAPAPAPTASAPAKQPAKKAAKKVTKKNA